MESPIKANKRLQNIDGIEKLAYDTLFTKYIVENKTGAAKLWEWESTDQESLIQAKNGGFPLPGSIYTFMYPPKDLNPMNSIKVGANSKSFIDAVPIVFCTGYKNGKIHGINFNLLPPKERINFLEVYFQGYKGFFKNIEELTENNILALNKKFISVASSPIGKLILEYFIKSTGANFKFAYRTYDAGNIANLRMIEYCEWNYIPFYQPKNALKGINFNEIYNNYWKTR